jgi:hypothetical protein
VPNSPLEEPPLLEALVADALPLHAPEEPFDELEAPEEPLNAFDVLLEATDELLPPDVADVLLEATDELLLPDAADALPNALEALPEDEPAPAALPVSWEAAFRHAATTTIHVTARIRLMGHPCACPLP